MTNATGMSRPICLLLALGLFACPVAAQQRPQGLLWHRSGLAATLPLQIKTEAGADYLLHLRDIETEQIVLAAYIRGGEFFRVLVPPGSFELMFSFGRNWQGEVMAFGPETQSLTLDQSLTFSATARRKNGHLIDLTDGGDIVVRDFAFCQRLARDPRSLRRPHRPVGTLRARPALEPFPPQKLVVPRYELRSHVCD